MWKIVWYLNFYFTSPIWRFMEVSFFPDFVVLEEAKEFLIPRQLVLHINIKICIYIYYLWLRNMIKDVVHEICINVVFYTQSLDRRQREWCIIGYSAWCPCIIVPRSSVLNQIPLQPVNRPLSLFSINYSSLFIFNETIDIHLQ